MTAHTPTPLPTGAIFMLKNLAAANAREGITSSLIPADVYSLCDELLSRRNADVALVVKAEALCAALENSGTRAFFAEQSELRAALNAAKGEA